MLFEASRKINKNKAGNHNGGGTAFMEEEIHKWTLCASKHTQHTNLILTDIFWRTATSIMVTARCNTTKQTGEKFPTLSGLFL